MTAASWCYGNSFQSESGSVGGASLSTPFDLASLTKLICTTMICKKMVIEDAIQLDDPIEGAYDRTWKELLLHESGYPAYLDPRPSETTAEFRRRIQEIVPSSDKSSVYSCLNFVHLGWALEAVGKGSLDKLFSELIVPVFKFNDTKFEGSPYSRPTRNPRSMEVHDPLARKLGGVSGNAGLFGSIEDMEKFCRMILSDHKDFGIHSWQNWLPLGDLYTPRGLGWDRKSEQDSTAGTLMSRNTFGHTGFTGTMIWIDFQNKIFASLLTNAVLCGFPRSQLMKMRQQFANTAFLKMTS